MEMSPSWGIQPRSTTIRPTVSSHSGLLAVPERGVAHALGRCHQPLEVLVVGARLSRACALPRERLGLTLHRSKLTGDEAAVLGLLQNLFRLDVLVDPGEL